MFALSKVGDALSDPIVGYLSDRTRLAAGRRRPCIFAAALPMVLTALVAFPIWFPLARRFGKREAWLLALALKSVGFVCMLLASPERAWLFPTAVLLIGSALACSIMLPPSIKADVIDYDEFVTGDRKEGAYFAA